MGELARAGSLANVLCRLAGSAFTGLVYAEHEEHSLVISIRDGRAVFVEDLGEQATISDTLLEQGLVTKEQYAEIAARVIESLAEDEDAAFCAIAVELGALSQQEVDAEIERRVRGRLIQTLAWPQCRIELDDDPDALTGGFEYPQQIGPLVYMGVRTFFDDERVRASLGAEADLYATLLHAPAEIGHFFQLEAEEVALLGALRPDLPIARVIEECAADILEGYQLICMLRLADAVELSPVPLTPSAERSGVRSARAADTGGVAAERADAPSARSGAGSQARIPVAREEHAHGTSRHARVAVPREDPAEPGSQRRLPAVREEYTAPGSHPRMPAASEQRTAYASQARMPAVREEVVFQGSRPRMPQVREDRVSAEPAARARSARGPSAEVAGAAAERSSTASPARRADSSAQRSRQDASAAPQPRPAHGTHGAAARRPSRDLGHPGAPGGAAAVHEAPTREHPAPPRKRPVRKLSNALRRLDRELKQVRPASAPTPRGESGAKSADYARAHVEQIVRMRQATLQKQTGAKQDEGNADELFQKAQEALRDQQFGRAHELLRKACDAAPNNEMYSTYCMWAAFRANVLQGDDLNKLRAALRSKVSDDDLKGFAYYALGHIALHEKKDEAAEKFFRKAVDLDKNNKDAERYLRIIELRRKTAATEQRSNKIFGIEIGSKKS